MKNAKCVVVVGEFVFHLSIPLAGYPLCETKWGEGNRGIRWMEIAERADIHLQLKPGTDGFLALAMARVIINENLIRQEGICRKVVLRVHKFKEHVQPYTLEKAEAITDTRRQKLIRESARLLAIWKPTARWWAKGKSSRSPLFTRRGPIRVSWAITGNIDKPGANLRFRMTKGFQQMRWYILEAKEFNVPEEVQRKRIGALQYPLWTNHFESVRFAHYPSVIKAMLYAILTRLVFLGRNGKHGRRSAQFHEIVSALKNLDFFVSVGFPDDPHHRTGRYCTAQAMGFEYDEINYVPFACSGSLGRNR